MYTTNHEMPYLSQTKTLCILLRTHRANKSAVPPVFMRRFLPFKRFNAPYFRTHAAITFFPTPSPIHYPPTAQKDGSKVKWLFSFPCAPCSLRVRSLQRKALKTPAFSLPLFILLDYYTFSGDKCQMIFCILPK